MLKVVSLVARTYSYIREVLIQIWLSEMSELQSEHSSVCTE